MKRRDEVTVGILLTVAVIVLFTGTVWLVRGGLRGGYPLFAQFPWGQSLKQGQPVLLAGVTVGYVSDVRLNPVGLLDVDMKIRSEYKVPRTSVAEVIPIGIFGDVAVALKPTGPSSVVFQPGDTIPGRISTGGLDAIEARADTITNTLNRVAASFETQFVQTGGIRDLRQSVASMDRLVAELHSVALEQNRNMTAMLAQFRRSAGALDSARLASTVETFRSAGANMDTLTQRLSTNTTQLQAILARLERGEGSAGKFMTDTLLYANAKNLLAHMDSLVTDFKQNPKKYINVRVF
jgi:phospholipid/cholesterol/gamma-HCH transport system substrate-binding protein